MLTISSGHSVDYLTGAVAAGRENYYTGAVAAGEPPGRWSGRGAARLGLSGLVDTQDMTALYERFIDPRDPAFRDPSRWDDPDTATLGHTGRKYLTEDEIYAAALAAEPGADDERRAALRLEAGKRARKNVAFLDATFSVQKSITVLHAAFEAQEVQARSAAERARAALTALDELAAGAPAASGGALGGAVDATSVPRGPDARRERRRLVAEIGAAEQAAAAWAEHRLAVEDAVWAGNQAALGYLAERAGYSRVGHHGGAAGRWIDAHDWTVASFFQHDSRDRDPQLHIHNAILNRVEGADGKWRTIDAKAMYRYRGAASAVGDRVMEQHLTQALGVRFATRPDGKAREILGIDQPVMDLFSSRRRAITKKTAQLVREFEAKFQRSPNSLELDRLQRTATFATRKAKSHDGESVQQRLARWDRELRAEVRGGLAQVAAAVLQPRRWDSVRDSTDGTGSPDSRPRRRWRKGAQRWRAGEVLETALADVQETKAAWTAGDLTRAISNALPDDLGGLRPDQVTRLLDGLTEQGLALAVPIDAQRPADTAVPADLRLANGASVYQSPGARLYATPAHIHTERLLASHAAHAAGLAMSTGRAAGAPAMPTMPAMSAEAAGRFLTGLREAGIELAVDQAAAVRGILTSGARVETLVGPAGTGKSFVVGALAKAWQDPDLWNGTADQRHRHRHQYRHRVVGLASSQVATDVLAGEGLTARNIARWLATQDRLAAGTPAGDDRAWVLRAGDLVVVDESAMANTPDLARIHQHCQTAGAKLLLTGDPRQLAAVGAAGAMELAAAAGVRHELVETRRFTHGWEGPASLRLREGDETVLAEYHKHGRLLDGGAIEQTEAGAARAWLADTLDGRHTLLIVDSNEQAARLSAQLRAELVRLGRVDDDQRVSLGLQGTYSGRGDVVQTRHNGWDLHGYRGNRRAPRNRDQYRVVDVGDDGSLVVAGIDQRTGQVIDTDRLTLPAAYVDQHVTLGYASTVHAAQGVTVDTSHTVTTTTTGLSAFYVGMSRGRHANTAHVVTRTVPSTGSLPDEAPTGAALQAVHRSPQAVLAGMFETSELAPQRSALAEATESAANAESLRTAAELFIDACELATAGRTARWLDQLVDHGHLSPADRMAIAAEDGSATLNRLLRRVELAGHNPQQVLTDAVTRRDLHDARQITNVLHRRITNTLHTSHTSDEDSSGSVSLDPVGDTYTEWTPRLDIDPQHATYLAALAEAADHRRAELGRHIADQQPQWAIETLGPPPPAHTEDGRIWRSAASTVAAHRELTGYDDPGDPLGPAPKPGQAEVYASWRAAWRALGRPDADRAEAEMSTGQLRIRVRAYEREKTWAPPYVADELAGTRQAAARHRADAALRRAEAQAATDEGTRLRLQAEAEQAAALADALDTQAEQLARADQARADWYAHTSATRAAADRAKAELSQRQATNMRSTSNSATRNADEPLVTAEEWLAAHAAADQAEDPHRQVTADHELADLEAEREHDHTAATDRRHGDDRDDDRDKWFREAPEPGPLDIRHETHVSAPAGAATPEQPGDSERNAASDTHTGDAHTSDAGTRDRVGVVRVPTADETADSVERARRALLELQRRKAIEDQRAADEATQHAEQAERERDDELARWHTSDHASVDQSDSTAHASTADGADGADGAASDTGPVLEVATDHD